jgi:group I intron endonuclease
MKSGIYKITNLKNGKFYIGSSKDIEFRWNEHKKHLNGGYHINNKLQNAWNFYGKESFEFSIIEITNEMDLLLREQFYLDMFKPHMKEIGYNINPTSNGGDTLTHNPKGQILIEEWRKKYSVLHKGKGNPMHGKKHSEEAKEKQKERAVGRYTLEWFVDKYGVESGTIKYKERNEKLANRNINYSYDNGLKGKKRGAMSDEMKRKISEQKRNFAIRKNEFIDDLKSGNFTNNALSEKYGVSLTTIKLHKRKY